MAHIFSFYRPILILKIIIKKNWVIWCTHNILLSCGMGFSWCTDILFIITKKHLARTVSYWLILSSSQYWYFVGPFILYPHGWSLYCTLYCTYLSTQRGGGGVAMSPSILTPGLLMSPSIVVDFCYCIVMSKTQLQKIIVWSIIVIVT